MRLCRAFPTPLAAILALLAACSAAHPDPTGSTGTDPGAGPGGDPGGTVLRTTPPVDGTTAWAPAPDDDTWANVQAHGAIGDGVADDTAAFAAATATGKKLFVPKPPLAYKLTRWVQLRNSAYGDGSMPEIRMTGATGDEYYSIFKVLDYTGPGLVVQGLHLNGQWNGYSRDAEYSHGLAVKGSQNVTIQHNRIERCYGDNILVGGEVDPNPSTNVLIEHNELVDPYRCNVAIISGDGVTIQENTIVKHSDYVTSIDAEPWASTDYFQNVKLLSNDFTVPNAVVVALSAPSFSPQSGNVEIAHNRGTRNYPFLITGAEINPYNTQSLVNITTVDNF